MLNKFCKKPLYEVTRTMARVAMGVQKAETVIKNARLVNVCTAEIQAGILDDSLRLLYAHGHARERARGLIQRLFAKLVQHPVSSLHVLMTASRS